VKVIIPHGALHELLDAASDASKAMTEVQGAMNDLQQCVAIAKANAAHLDEDFRPLHTTLEVWGSAGLLRPDNTRALASVIADAIKSMPIITHAEILRMIQEELS
jgi:hypothetical protein